MASVRELQCLCAKSYQDCLGLTLVQDPATAEVAAMPEAAIKLVPVKHILPLDQIGAFLAKLDR